MIQVRLNTFETNSSSTHSLVICDDDTWKDFLDGKLLYNYGSKRNGLPEFMTPEEFEAHYDELFALHNGYIYGGKYIESSDCKEFLQHNNVTGLVDKYKDICPNTDLLQDIFEMMRDDYSNAYNWVNQYIFYIYRCSEIDEYTPDTEVPHRHGFEHFFG